MIAGCLEVASQVPGVWKMAGIEDWHSDAERRKSHILRNRRCLGPSFLGPCLEGWWIGGVRGVGTLIPGAPQF